MHSWLQSLSEAESLHDLTVIILESTFENFVNVVVPAVQTFLNHVWREFQLTESYKIFGDLSKNLLVLCLVSEFENILHEIVSVWVFNKILHLVDNEVG